MPESDDIKLLKQYAEGDEFAFTVLVERYINLVYSAAMRQVCNPSHAEEITQAVFIILTQKAKSLSPKTILSGWLYQTARLTAANFLRSENSRQQREQEVFMQSTLAESESVSWEQISPLLEEAMGRLGDADRNAIVLQFFENKTPQEVATTLKVTEVTARKRVSRALEKLRKIFTKRGVVLPAAVLTTVISANSVQAAPVGVAVTISATTTKGVAVATNVSALVKGTLKLMTYAKLKLTLGISMAILIAGGAVTIAISQVNGGTGGLTPQEIVKKSRDVYAALSSYSDSGVIVQDVGGQTLTTTFNIQLQRPNLYRVEWTQATEFFTNGGVVWSAKDGDFLLMKHVSAKPEKYRDMQSALSAATGVSGQASATIPATFFNIGLLNRGNVLNPNPARTALQKQNDGSVDGVDCYVVSGSLDPSNLPNKGTLPDSTGKMGKTTITLWIGKQDYLIHQSKTVMEGITINLPQMSDSDIKTILKQSNTAATPEAIASMRKRLDEANKQAQSMMASGKIVFTQTHENIVENPNLSAADFAR